MNDDLSDAILFITITNTIGLSVVIPSMPILITFSGIFVSSDTLLRIIFLYGCPICEVQELEIEDRINTEGEGSIVLITRVVDMLGDRRHIVWCSCYAGLSLPTLALEVDEDFVILVPFQYLIVSLIGVVFVGCILYLNFHRAA
jgi:hypothetical protein